MMIMITIQLQSGPLDGKSIPNPNWLRVGSDYLIPVFRHHPIRYRITSKPNASNVQFAKFIRVETESPKLNPK
jgi:hypothetical protein